jgi:hypothetical protein
MILLISFVLFAALVASMYFYLQRQPDRAHVWRNTLTIGFIAGALRAALATFGWYTIEHTGGPLQIPAYALALLAWPEGMFLDGRRLGPAPPEFYVRLCLVLVVSTFAVVGAVAALADMTRASRE